MKIGLIARADNSGLGIQTWEFYKHMHPYRTMVVDISRLNGNKQYYERYPDIHTTMFIKGFPTPNDIDYFLQELDVVFVAESPYNYYLYERARELGVKVAVQYNYEFFDWFAHPEYPKPDLLIAPSAWHYTDVNIWCAQNRVDHIYLHCPVNREVLPKREITQARTFLHIAGRSAAHDRNGTEIVIAASKYLETDAQIIIHFQGEQGVAHQMTHTIAEYAEYLHEQGNEDKCILEQFEYENYWDIYASGDVLLLPRRYGGNCLPLNEALSTGMPVIMTDVSPNNTFLPKDWLIPAERVGQFTPRTTIDIYGSEPKVLAQKIDELYRLYEVAMQSNNQVADNLAQTISWENMKPKYDKAFAKLCTQ